MAVGYNIYTLSEVMLSTNWGNDWVASSRVKGNKANTDDFPPLLEGLLNLILVQTGMGLVFEYALGVTYPL